MKDRKFYIALRTSSESVLVRFWITDQPDGAEYEFLAVELQEAAKAAQLINRSLEH